MSTTSDHAALSRKDTGGFHAGQTIGGYTLVAQIASGGMAHVWTAEPGKGSGLGRTVAIKIIREELAGDREYARMFVDEATIASAIEHPNVCQTHELGRSETLLYMVMEWVPGDSLSGMLRQGEHFEPLPWEIAARICADACGGLHAAHEALGPDGLPLGVIHRDVSPPNILISLQGQVKVSDFGIAKARQQLHERTKTGEVKGKFAYLAPEQIAGNVKDRRIDVYAMGCVLYVATLGARPFGNGPKAMPKILLGEYKKPSEVDPMFPPGLEAIIVRALQLKPDERFRTADEMRAALEQWLVDSRHVVTATDIARTLSERMKPESLKAVNALKARKVGRTSVSFEALLDAIDDLEPPTAASGVVVPPFDLLEKSRSFPPAKASDLSDATEDATVRTDVRPQSTAVAGADKERSGWHRTGREDPTLTEKSRVASSAHQTTSGSPQRDSDHIATVVPPARSRPTPAWIFAAMVLVIALLYALWRAVR